MIPHELTLYPQWVVASADKVLRTPDTLNKADVMRPETWGTYEQAINATRLNSHLYIGFVFTVNDPYCFIDLDDKAENPASPGQKARHAKILTAFNSYQETSISGRGQHIIIRGSVPSGIDRDHVGIYSDKRYVLLTGEVIGAVTEIRDHNELVNMLWAEASKGSVTGHQLIQVDGLESDEVIIDRAMTASNKDKFISLCRGDISGYPSHSEADLGLLSILCFYTPDNDQAIRIFMMTELAKRKKAGREGYLENTIRRIRANEPKVDLSQFRLPEVEEPAVDHIEEVSAAFDLPPGVVGELTRYFYTSAVRPVPEVALAAAIGLTAGIVGRSYNISGTGLNQYVILLAKTGAGKEGIASGIERVINTVRKTVPMAERFIGPAAFASGQALVRALNDRQCFVSILGEFGLTLQQISSDRASGAEKQLRKVFLDLYTKSGWGRMLQPSVYSDNTKDTKTIHAPNVTLLGESTPETFYDGIDLSHVAEGLISRFMVIEYKGERPPRNEHAGQEPDPGLTQMVSDLIVCAQTTTANNQCVEVQMDSDGKRMLDAFDKLCDAHINGTGNELAVQLYNRGHLKALKLSALLAVGCNMHNPVVDSSIAGWAIDFVQRDIKGVLARYNSGDVGTGDSKQMADVRSAIFKLVSTKNKDEQIERLRKDGIVTYRSISQRVLQLSSLKNDRLGATNALKKIIGVMVDHGSLIEVTKVHLIKNYAFNGKAYVFDKRV